MEETKQESKIVAALKWLGREMRDRVWKSKKSTIIGLGIYAADGLLAALGTVQNPVIHIVVGLVGTAFVAWKGKMVSSGQAIIPIALLILGLGTARADDALQFSILGATARAVAGFSGSAFDFKHDSAIRSVQISGLAEVDIVKDKLGLAAGASLQTGDIIGFNATGLLTFPILVPPGSKVIPAAGVTATLFGQKDSLSGIVGTVMRF